MRILNAIMQMLSLAKRGVAGSSFKSVFSSRLKKAFRLNLKGKPAEPIQLGIYSVWKVRFLKQICDIHLFMQEYLCACHDTHAMIYGVQDMNTTVVFG